MGVNLKGKSFLTLLDFTSDEIRYLLDISKQVKVERRAGTPTNRFAGKTLAIVFEKRSTRTRTAFETAFGEEGGHAVFLSKDDIHLGVKEDLKDTARVLGRMFDAIAFRGFKQETVETLANWSGVPVYNGLTDLYHPTQILADFHHRRESGQSQRQKTGLCRRLRNNMANSLMIGSAKMGFHRCVRSEESSYGYGDSGQVQRDRQNLGATIEVTEDIDLAVKNADAIYTTWASMGEEGKPRRESLLNPSRSIEN